MRPRRAPALGRRSTCETRLWQMLQRPGSRRAARTQPVPEERCCEPAADLLRRLWPAPACVRPGDHLIGPVFNEAFAVAYERDLGCCEGESHPEVAESSRYVRRHGRDTAAASAIRPGSACLTHGIPRRQTRPSRHGTGGALGQPGDAVSCRGRVAPRSWPVARQPATPAPQSRRARPTSGAAKCGTRS
jgi:hypothetical protein